MYIVIKLREALNRREYKHVHVYHMLGMLFVIYTVLGMLFVIYTVLGMLFVIYTVLGILYIIYNSVCSIVILPCKLQRKRKLRYFVTCKNVYIVHHSHISISY